MSRAICIAAALFVMTAGRAWADLPNLVGVTFTGGAQSPTNWTRIGSSAPATISDLIDESGQATNVSITFSSPQTEFFFGGTGLAPSTVPMHTPSLADLNGNVDGNQLFDVTLSGLSPDSVYDVWVFAARFAIATDQAVTITGQGAPTSFVQSGPATDLVVNSQVGSSAEPLSFYAVPIESDASGQIEIAITPLTTDDSFGVSGIAIQGAVPEPATVTLLGMGVAGVAGHGWRRRRRGGPARA